MVILIITFNMPMMYTHISLLSYIPPPSQNFLGSLGSSGMARPLRASGISRSIRLSSLSIETYFYYFIIAAKMHSRATHPLFSNTSKLSSSGI